MCVMSMIMDHYDDKWRKYIPDPNPYIVPEQPWVVPNGNPVPYYPSKPSQFPSQDEIDEFYRLLERAREYDKRNNEPDCEMESKKQKLRDLAKELGVEINI